ncbi:MAG TPA: tRNA (N(6)-L-threonylcarbamoyladenosine(37)-C(2))-methylthiotransferase MtaB [Acidobacteriota bacterium]|nr:tRNA (N(6)-L-threonylcarbamoyladenosine(37)-C(2))-methylthiotransferase MtaB [Acidobacteriota bacterium]
MNVPKSFIIITLGCKVNQFESACLQAELLKAGWVEARRGERIDVAIVNTCIVTQRAAHQSRQAIRKLIRENPNGVTAAVGCYAQVFPDELAGIQGIGMIAGNTVKGELPELILNTKNTGEQRVILKNYQPEMPFDMLQLRRFPGRTRAFLKIQDGCESFCSYCIVPLARGPYRSLPPANVLSMIESLATEGYREVVLTGIHLGKYGVDLEGEMNLNLLLRAIGRQALPLRIRLSSLEPNEIDTDIIEMVAAEKWLCPHFHIPLQSGDDTILKKMNRNYTAAEFAKIIESIFGMIPLVSIGVDIMSGFPGEDHVAHQNTCSVINNLPISYLHVFPFSPRKGTAAAAYDGQVDPKVIKKRAAELRDLGREKRSAFYKACLGKQVLVLAEEWRSEENMTKGMTDNYIPVLFPSPRDLKGQLIPVRLERVSKNMVIGSIVNP